MSLDVSDFIMLGLTVVFAVIGWLVRQQFATFSQQLSDAVSQVQEIKDDHGNRITALETTVQGFKPRGRRKEDT